MKRWLHFAARLHVDFLLIVFYVNNKRMSPEEANHSRLFINPS